MKILTKSRWKKVFIISVGSLGDDRYHRYSLKLDVIIGLPGSIEHTWWEWGTDIIQGDEDADRLYGEKDNDIIQGGLEAIDSTVTRVMIYLLVG